MKQALSAVVVCLALCPALPGTSQSTSEAAGLPRVMTWSPEVAVQLRAQAQSNDPALADALASLRRAADRGMECPPLSVTHKTFIPPSGDPHDFSTIGRYWWPNPDTADGLPWVRRDGDTNPQYFDPGFGDTQRFVDLCEHTTALSRAYFLTGQESYGEKAASLLRTWFLDEATRMNPHAKFAARFPGHWDGKSWGIHGTRQLVFIADSVGFLEGCPAWSESDQAGMRQWMNDYLDWLLTSENGIEEGQTINNHAVAYDWLVARLAVFAERPEVAREVLEAFKQKRIAAQIEPDGSMPAEMARATSWRYVGYSLEYLFANAILADQLGIDLWDYSTGDGRSIKAAFDFLVMKIEPSADGPVDEAVLKAVDVKRIGPLLAIAAEVYDEPAYRDLMNRIGWKDTPNLVGHGPARQVLRLD